MSVSIDAQMADFLYWHAVSKMRMAEFSDAEALFRLLHSACAERNDAAVGRVYCLVRLGRVELARELVATLRKSKLDPIQVALLGRLQRRCELERSRGAVGHGEFSRRDAQPGTQRKAVMMPHTLGDDQMARLAAEQL